MTRGQVSIRDLALGFAVLTMVFMSVGWYLSSAISENAAAIPSDRLQAFNNSFSKYDDLSSSSAELQSQTESISGGDPGLFGFLNSIINQSWNTLTSIFSTFGFIITIFDELRNFLGVPGYIVGLASIVITIIFVFSLLKVVFNREP